MKKKDLNDLKAQTKEKLEIKLRDLEKEKTDTLIELKMGKIKDTNFLSKKRKDIAQVKTLINMKDYLKKSQSEIQPKEKN